MVLHNCRFLVSPRETSHYYQLRPVIFVRLKYADDLPADTASRSFLPTFEAKTRQNVKSPLKFNFFTPLQLTLRHLFSCLRFEFGFHLHCQNKKPDRVPKLNRKIFNNFILINSTDRIKNVHWLFTQFLKNVIDPTKRNSKTSSNCPSTLISCPFYEWLSNGWIDIVTAKRFFNRFPVSVENNVF